MKIIFMPKWRKTIFINKAIKEIHSLNNQLSKAKDEENIFLRMMMISHISTAAASICRRIRMISLFPLIKVTIGNREFLYSRKHGFKTYKFQTVKPQLVAPEEPTR